MLNALPPAAAPDAPGAPEAPVWTSAGFAGAWRCTAGGRELLCDPDVASALGLPCSTDLASFLAVIDPGDRDSVAAAIAAGLTHGGRINRRFKLASGPANGQWARLSALGRQGVLAGAITDLPGEAARLDSWRDAETRFRHAFDQTPTTAVQGYDSQRRVIYWNAASEALYGWRREEALGRLLEELIIPPAMRSEVVRLHTRWLEHDEPIPAAELELARKDGSPVPVFSSHVLLRNGWGEPEMYCIDVDLREQRDALREGHLREQQLRLVSQASHAGWWSWTRATDTVQWSAELARWFGGNGAGQAARGDLLALLPPETLNQLAPLWHRLMQSQSDPANPLEAIEAEIRHVHDGQERHFLVHIEADAGEPGRRMGTLLDITESKQAAARIDRLAQFDALTGLPTRLLMRERLQEAIERSQRQGTKLLVACIGIDHFHRVNESFGTGLGDALLTAVGARLQQRLRGHDLVVRLSGDQFGVLLEGVRDVQEAEALATKLMSLFQQAFVTPAEGNDPAQELFLGASMGLSLHPEDGSTPDGLLQQAEAALHLAKEQGRGHHQFYRAEMNARSLERVQLLNHLRRALPKNELSLHFQPKFGLDSRQLLGAEALLRWHSGELGPVGPDRFIPLAEECGLIEPIGGWVLARCCEALRGWHAAGHTQLRMAANLSGRQFRDPHLVTKLAETIRETGISPGALELEVTESVLLDRDGRSRDMLFALKDLGVTLAIDDFGTGYSSLSYLRRFPIDVLKIDRSFVADLGQDPDADVLVRAIVSMAHALKLSVVAEGVETAAQAAFLSALGCEAGQGWLFGRPVPDADFRERFLK